MPAIIVKDLEKRIKIGYSKRFSTLALSRSSFGLRIRDVEYLRSQIYISVYVLYMYVVSYVVHALTRDARRYPFTGTDCSFVSVYVCTHTHTQMECSLCAVFYGLCNKTSLRDFLAHAVVAVVVAVAAGAASLVAAVAAVAVVAF